MGLRLSHNNEKAGGTGSLELLYQVRFQIHQTKNQKRKTVLDGK